MKFISLTLFRRTLVMHISVAHILWVSQNGNDGGSLVQLVGVAVPLVVGETSTEIFDMMKRLNDHTDLVI